MSYDKPAPHSAKFEALIEEVSGALAQLPDGLQIRARAALDEITAELRGCANREEQPNPLREAFRQENAQAAWIARLPEENPNPVARVSVDGTILYHNRIAASMFGPAFAVGSRLPEQLMTSLQAVIDLGEKREFDIPVGEKTYSVTLVPSSADNIVNLYCLDITERKRDQEALHQSRVRMQEILESIHDSFFEVDRDWRFSFINHRAASRSDHTPEDLIGKNLWETFPNLAGNELEAAYRRVMQDRIPETLEIKGFISGTWYDTRIYPSSNGITVYATDISPRKAAESALKLERAKLAAAIDNLPVGVGIEDGQGNTVSMNAAALKLHGFSSEAEMYSRLERYSEDFELIRMDGTVLPVNEWPAVKALSGEYVRDFPVILRGKRSGVESYISYSSAPVLSSEGETALILFVMQDIAERIRGEQALRQSEARERARAAELEAVMDTVPAIIWIARDPEVRELIGNRYSYEFLNVPHGANVSKTAPQEITAIQKYHMEKDGRVLPPDELPIQIAAATGKPTRDFLADLVSTDGDCYNLLGNVNPLFDQDGKPYGSVGVFMDITNFRRLEAEQVKARAELDVQRRLLEQREQERQAIARELHDGPIQTLSSSTFHLHLIRELFDNPALQVELNGISLNIKKTIHDLREVLNDLRPPALMHFGFSRVLQLYTHDLTERFPNLAIDLDVQDDDRLLSDQARLALYRIYQAGMSNIVRHAAATQVRVVYHVGDGRFRFELHDNGRGFEVPQDFTALNGSGYVGLLSMRERAEAIGGNFGITSTPGRGTTITVTGPLQAAQ